LSPNRQIRRADQKTLQCSVFPPSVFVTGRLAQFVEQASRADVQKPNLLISISGDSKGVSPPSVFDTGKPAKCETQAGACRCAKTESANQLIARFEEAQLRVRLIKKLSKNSNRIRQYTVYRILNAPNRASLSAQPPFNIAYPPHPSGIFTSTRCISFQSSSLP
jgi:hypothetical protein